MENHERMKNNLSIVRSLFGLTAVDLAKALDVSRAAVYNMENSKQRITTIQYRAILHVFSCEIRSMPEAIDKDILRLVVRALLRDDDERDESEREEIKEAVNLIAPSVVGKKATKELAYKNLAILTKMGVLHENEKG